MTEGNGLHCHHSKMMRRVRFEFSSVSFLVLLLGWIFIMFGSRDLA